MQTNGFPKARCNITEALSWDQLHLSVDHSPCMHIAQSTFYSTTEEKEMHYAFCLLTKAIDGAFFCLSFIHSVLFFFLRSIDLLYRYTAVLITVSIILVTRIIIPNQYYGLKGNGCLGGIYQCTGCNLAIPYAF